MDILSPDLIWIAGRCYRVNEEYSNKTVGADVQEETDLYDFESYNAEQEDEFDFEIETTENGRFRTSFHVPQFYYAQIIGSKGVARKRIENETKTQIRIPRQGEEGLIVITGATGKSVVTARRRVELIVIACRSKQPFTHFLSIPFGNIAIKEKFEEFRADILSKYGTLYPKSLFQVPEKLHLTLGTMCLMDNDDRALAAELLNECKLKIIDPMMQENGPLRLHLFGIEYMNDDPTAVDVLYGRVNDGSDWAEAGRLQKMADRIVDSFIRKGLMQKQYDNVKLHVTLMNSLFENDDNSSRKTFDASSILHSYEYFDFGVQELREIHLSQRYSTGCDGYYQSTMTINC